MCITNAGFHTCICKVSINNPPTHPPVLLRPSNLLLPTLLLLLPILLLHPFGLLLKTTK